MYIFLLRMLQVSECLCELTNSKPGIGLGLTIQDAV